MSRYIEADRAIESLFDYCIGKKTIGQCIDDTPTADVYGKWVSVKEKLPKDGVDVLAYLESGEYVIRHIVEVFGYKEWSGGQIGERTHNVIAWQPLPAPYKESEE